MSLILRKFLKADKKYLSSINTDTRDCVEKLFNRGNAEKLYIAEADYGTLVWADKKLLISDPKVHVEKPIGLVLEGALEITERFSCDGTDRLRTTKILRPGDFFGLFEAFGDLYGQWEIFSGVQRFWVTNPLGNFKKLKKNGWDWISEPQLNTLQHLTAATYDYSELVKFATNRGSDPNQHIKKTEEKPWQAIMLVFDQMNCLDDHEALRFLYSQTIAQLVSLVRQNPTDALLEKLPNVKESADELKVSATLDAILADHIPVFALYRPEHESYGPFKKIFEIVENLWSIVNASSDNAVPVHLWIPDYWSNIQEPGAMYIDALSKRFKIECVDCLFQVGHNGKFLCSGTRIEKANHTDRLSVNVITTEQQSALIRRLTAKKEGRRLPDEIHQLLFPQALGENSSYGWPMHLSQGLFLQRTVR